MIEKADFKALVELALSTPGQQHMRPVIEKELLHFDILFALEKEGLLDPLTFQGGTSLRLCHGSNRYSEDLDFVGGEDFASIQLMEMKRCVEHYIGERYELEVTVKEPSDLRKEPAYADIKVDRWQIAVTTSPNQKDVPKQKIKIEVANLPAYSREPKALRRTYSFLPDGYDDILILTETLNEIMADKIVSLVNTTRYVRHRDIWDLRWLKQKDIQANMTWVKNKISDYRIDDFSKKLDATRINLPNIIHGEPFSNELSRFIPVEVQLRTLKKEKFRTFLINEIVELLDNVENALF